MWLKDRIFFEPPSDNLLGSLKELLKDEFSPCENISVELQYNTKHVKLNKETR